MGPLAIRPGARYPTGATLTSEGVNFSAFSRHATRVELLLYERADSAAPFQTITLDPEVNRTFFVWHVFVEGLRAGAHYTWRADGPTDTAASGRCFNPRKELCDPWAQAVTDAVWSRARACDPADNGGSVFRAIVSDPGFDWGGVPPGARGLEGAVIYELHVGGFTRHPSAGVAHPGTFAGLIEKIPYLKELGITHVELLPVMAFDEQDIPPAVAARGLTNFWGYSTHSFYSPHPRYCVDAARGAREFKELVRALHAAGIGVILDVVFNHTAEGGAGGPYINFRGLANEIFYHLDPLDRGRYLDFTGCGNTVNCNHPQVTAFIIHCLEYWAEHMRVDGFRFDLASVFARGENGVPLATPPLPWGIEMSRVLVDRPLIAEAWDAAGLYHVGAFPGLTWAEWNGRYRDCLRRFVRGDAGLTGEVATRIGGSSDLYADDGRMPANGINFITCHDGFTLWDLVSHNGKHNEANGEDNRDGTNDNLSWNGGMEGDTDDAEVLRRRRRQAKNFLAILMLSRGTPMLLAGDEVLRSQRGNNNAYCQDNELSWFDWRLVETNRDILRFVCELIRLRRRHPSLTANRFYKGAPLPGRGIPDIAWHGVRPGEPPWHDPQARVLAVTIAGSERDEEDLHAVFNMSDDTIDAPLPAIAGRRWHLVLDTALASPQDIARPEEQTATEGDHYVAQPRSVVVLEAHA
jgi:glycogen operon protein